MSGAELLWQGEKLFINNVNNCIILKIYNHDVLDVETHFLSKSSSLE